MQLSSSAFSSGSVIPRRYTCDGEDLSPPLEWEAAPPTTRSFVLLCDDPDAPGGKWHHWAAYDIAAGQEGLAEGAGHGSDAARLKQAINDFHRPGYGGPCPPPGDHPHRYLFTVFAVGAESLQVTADTSAAVIGFQLHFNTLAKAALMGLYKR